MDIFKAIYLAGVRIRNKMILPCYHYLKETEKYDLQALRDIQLSRLQELVKHAGDHSGYYREKFARCGFDPSKVRSLDDLASIPITSKDELRANSVDIQIPVRGEKMFRSATSGSTGNPLTFYRNQEWDAWHNASVLRGFSWHGVEPWERSGYLRSCNLSGSHILQARFLDFLQNRFRLYSYNEHELEGFVRRLGGATFLEGYSSMIYEVAKKLNAGGMRYDSLKMVKGTSETILDAYQGEAQKAFGRKIISEYGSAEGGIIAFECPYGSMHLNMETAIVESIDNEIVVTNLVSRSFPIIRYRLGDYAVFEDSTKCGCGMAHGILREVSGRAGAVVYGKVNKYPAMTLYCVFKKLALEKGLLFDYQVLQEAKGRVAVRIEGPVAPSERGAILSEFREYFSDDLDASIDDNFRRGDYSTKKKDFISTLC